MIKNFVPVTHIVRAVLRKHGVPSDRIFTNDYEKCKTVKTYLSRIPNLTEVSGDIRTCLVEAGLTGFQIKTIQRQLFGRQLATSFIVRLPKE